MAESAMIAQLLRTRLLVAAIGERLQEPWWRTHFLTPTGVSYGERLFPRGYGAAALSSVTVAARRDHDANTGTHTFHLFRLPTQIEHQLAQAASQYADWDLPSGTDALVELLDGIEPKGKVKFSVGPKSVGKVSELEKHSLPGTLASLYAEAVRTTKRIYPYLEAADE